jgi:HAE1 family hydrophobic/amphiphilic exporter-1
MHKPIRKIIVGAVLCGRPPSKKGNHTGLPLRIVTLIFVAFCFTGLSEAAEPRILTLEEALSIAREKNRDIERAREYGRYVEGKYVEERSAALPQLTLSGNVNRSQDDSQAALFGGLISTRTDTRAIDVSLSQPLYTWGKVGAAIRAAKVGMQTSEDRLRQARQSAERDASAAFYDVLLARELLGTARQNLEQKERHLDEVRRKYAAGVATDYDVLAAEVAVANARPEVIRSENRVRSTRDRLSFTLALDQEVDATGSLVAGQQALVGYDDALTSARKNRPELQELRHKIGIAGELVTIANADDRPRLDLKGAYGWRQLESGSTTADGFAWNAGVYLSFPFFDGLKTRGRVTQAESDLRSLNVDEAKLVDSIALEVRDAVNSVRESDEIVTALSGTVTQAERLLSMAEKGYELGVKIRLEVDDAELNLMQARGNLARARRDLLVARTNLAWVMGVLGEKGMEK